MKNRRDVCAATEAGFTEYTDLPWVVKTGCQRTPAFQSKFCYDHSPRVGVESAEQLASSQENVVAFITSKKQTRNGNYYQVYM